VSEVQLGDRAMIGDAAASPKIPAVSLSRVGMTYQSATGPIDALKNVSLTVAPGEFVSLIGPSGCGKSTLLRLIADILKSTSGEIEVGGLTPFRARQDRRYSFVFQEPVLLPWRNIQDNVALPLELSGEAPDKVARKVGEMLDVVQLSGFGERMPRELSGGMRMRASLARALTQNPPLLLMDEPFGALDEITRSQMNKELLRVLDATSAAVMFVTHSIDEAVFLSDRVAVMSARPGVISQIVSIDLPRPRDYEALIESAPFEACCRTVRRALHA
jgi:NitT/TauT family transport system ATP-binding protein